VSNDNLEFREILEQIELTSSQLARLEFTEQIQHAERTLHELKQRFDQTLTDKLTANDREKCAHFELLRPILGHPSRKSELDELDRREKARQNAYENMIDQLRNDALVNKT
jgi:hypothetical protein